MKPTQHTPCHRPIKVGDLDYTAEQINQLLSLIPYKADRKEISALISFTGQNYIGHYPSATLLKPQDRFAWALVGSLSAAAPYFFYTAGNEPEGYTAGWNNMQPVFGTYDLAQEDKEDEITSEDFMRIPLHLPLLTADRAIADEHGNRIADTYETRQAVRNHIREVYNEQFTENPPLIMDEYITPQMLSEGVKDMLSQAGATINNVPDGEDLTTKNGVLKLSDKPYNPGAYSGMGRVYLRKNLVGGQNLLTQAMVSKPNTIYILQYDCTLDGKSITIPEGCVLSYEGGSIRDGHINYTDTLIEGKESLNNVTESGAAIHHDNEERKLNGQGMDCIILKKTPYLTQDMVSKPNTIYIIRYNYDLNGAEITIPEDCVLDFQGGSFSNGTITGANSIVKSNQNIIFYNIVILGTWLNNRAFGEWFGKYNDDSVIIRNLLTLSNNIILKANSEYHLYTKISFKHNYNVFNGNGSILYLEDKLISNGVYAEAFAQYGDLKFTNCKIISNLKSAVAATNDFKVFWNEKNIDLYVDNVDFYHDNYIEDSNIIVFFLMSNKNVTIKNGNYTIKTGSYRGGFCWIYPKVTDSIFVFENLNIDQETGDEPIAVYQRDEDENLTRCRASLYNINIIQKSHKNTTGFTFGTENADIDIYCNNVNYKVKDDSYPVYAIATKAPKGNLKIKFDNSCLYNNTSTFTFCKASGNTDIEFNNSNIDDNAQYWFGGESHFWNGRGVYITFKSSNLNVRRNLFQSMGNLGNIPAKGKCDLISCVININSNRLFSTYNCFGDYKATLLNNVINVDSSIGTFDIDESYTGISYNRLNEDLGYLIAVNNKIIKGSEFFDFSVIHKWSDRTFLFVNTNNKSSANYIYNGFNQDASNVYVRNIFDYPESENLPSLVADGAVMQHTKNGTTNLTIPKVLKTTKDSKAYFIPIIGYNKNYLLNNITYGNNEEVYISRGTVSTGDITLNINDKVLRIAKDRSTFWEVPLNNMRTKYVGNNNERPTNPNRGFQYYDIYLDKPIWWTGNKWVDATGAEV